MGEADIAAAKDALMARGYEARIYGRPVAELADALAELAREGLGEGERALLDPIARLVERRTTLARIACAGGDAAVRAVSDPLADPAAIEALAG